MSNALFIFGLGYTSLTLARLLQQEGWNISGTCRRREKCAALASQGIETFLFDEVPESALREAPHLLISIPPQENIGDPVLAKYGDVLKHCGNLRWIGYLSTTGVYGDTDGAWVDESSPIHPPDGRLTRRAGAEAAWLDFNFSGSDSSPRATHFSSSRLRGEVGRGVSIGMQDREEHPRPAPPPQAGEEKDNTWPIHIFRLAGIYGPGRNALEDVKRGIARRIDKPGQVFSRIHVDDIVQVLCASMCAPNPGAIYNVCDDEPAPVHEVVGLACELLGVKAPDLVSFAQAELSPMARSFYQANRRVRNDRIKRELGVTLYYPGYREGLRAMVHHLG